MLKDVSRCHDSGCDERENCQRWTNRKDKGDNISHHPSLFPYDISLESECPMIIEVDNKEIV